MLCYTDSNAMWMRERYAKRNRSSRPELLCKKGILKNFAKFIGKHLCQSHLFNKITGLRSLSLLNFIKKETLAQVFSCEFCEIFKNNNFYRTPLVAASEESVLPISTVIRKVSVCKININQGWN